MDEKPQQHLNKCNLLLDVVSNLIHSFSVCSFVGRPIVRLNLGHRFFVRGFEGRLVVRHEELVEQFSNSDFEILPRYFGTGIYSGPCFIYDT
jgi:hypothetical protein